MKRTKLLTTVVILAALWASAFAAMPQRMVIPAGTHDLGSAGPSVSVEISAFCLDRHRAAPRFFHTFDQVLNPGSGAVVSRGGVDFTLSEALEAGFLSVTGNDSNLSLRLTNHTESALTVTFAEPVVLSRAGDLPYALPLETIKNFDFRASEAQGQLWKSIAEQQLEQFGSVGSQAFDRARLEDLDDLGSAARLLTVQLRTAEEGAGFVVASGEGELYRGFDSHQMIEALITAGFGRVSSVYIDLIDFSEQEAANFRSTLDIALEVRGDANFRVQAMERSDSSLYLQQALFTRGVRLLAMSQEFDDEQQLFTADLAMEAATVPRPSRLNLGLLARAQSTMQRAVVSIRALFDEDDRTTMSLAELLATVYGQGDLVDVEAVLSDQAGRVVLLERPSSRHIIAEPSAKDGGSGWNVR